MSAFWWEADIAGGFADDVLLSISRLLTWYGNMKYRLYVMDRDESVGPPAMVECQTEIEAIEKARGLLHTRDIEVRRGTRVIARLRPTDR